MQIPSERDSDSSTLEFTRGLALRRLESSSSLQTNTASGCLPEDCQRLASARRSSVQWADAGLEDKIGELAAIKIFEAYSDCGSATDKRSQQSGSTSGAAAADDAPSTCVPASHAMLRVRLLRSARVLAHRHSKW